LATGFPATSVDVVDSTTITCVSPAHAAGLVEVTVTTPAGTSSTTGTANDFAYDVPTVTELSPAGGPIAGGTYVTITGSGFLDGATVAFGTGYPATSVVWVNATTITCCLSGAPRGHRGMSPSPRRGHELHHGYRQ